MSKLPTMNKDEYLHLVEIIKHRHEQHNLIFTQNKESVFKILFENNQHLSVNDVVDIFNRQSTVELKHSTVYRILSTFTSLGIVNHIVINGQKRYEMIYFKAPHYHLHCQECNSIEEFEDDEIHQVFLKKLKKIDFQAINFNVIINGVCKKCQK